MSKQNEQLVAAVSRIKEAGEIIEQLQAKNQELATKLAAAPKFDEKYTEKARSIVSKLASIEFEGRRLIPADQVERFVSGFQQPQNVIGVFGQVVDHYGKLAAMKHDSNDRMSDGTSSNVKTASVDDTPVARLATGRIKM